MTDYQRELIAEETGLNPCVVTGSYRSCDGDCDNCPDCIEFVNGIKEHFEKLGEKNNEYC